MRIMPAPAASTGHRWVTPAVCLLVLVLLPARHRFLVGLVMVMVWAWRRAGLSVPRLVRGTFDGVAFLIVWFLLLVVAAGVVGVLGNLLLAAL